MKLNPILWIILFFLVSSWAEAQNYWIKKAGGQGNSEALDMASDVNGNIYVTGYFSGTCVFNVSPNIVVNSSGADDIFIAKYTPQGNLIWVRHAGGGMADKGVSVAVTPKGDTYVTGFFTGNAFFGSINIVSTGGSPDVFVAKYDSSGQILWVRKGGGNGIDISNGIAVDTIGNCVVTGEVINTATFGSFSFTTQIEPSTGLHSYDVFIARYDSSGNVVWLKQGAANHADRGMSVAMDNQSNAYVVLQFSDTITFNSVYYNVVYNAIGLLKVDPSGNELWMDRAGGGAMQIAYNIILDASNNIYLTGDFMGNLYFFGTPVNILSSTGANNIFVAKFDSNGAFQWASSKGSSSSVSSRSIALDNSDNVYVTGQFKCRMDDFAAPYGTGIFNSVGFNDVFVAEFSSTGTFSWARQAGGKDNDFSYSIIYSQLSHRPVIAGGFRRYFSFPMDGASIPGTLSSDDISTSVSSYCGDGAYNSYLSMESYYGSSDVFVGDFIDLNRQPYDYYHRSGSSCIRDIVPGCLAHLNDFGTNRMCEFHTNDNSCDPDTIQVCDSTVIYSATHTSDFSPCAVPYQTHHFSIGPDYRYYWSTGDSVYRGIIIDTTGQYSMHAVSADGCFSFDDSVYVIINHTVHPSVSDDYVIATDSYHYYSIEICSPDTVTLTGGHYAGATYLWTGTGLPGAGINDTVISADYSGIFDFTATTSAGCIGTVEVHLILDNYPHLDSVTPVLVFSHPSLLNDTIRICHDSSFLLDILDSVTHNCVTYLSTIYGQGTLTINGSVNPYSYSSNDVSCVDSYFPSSDGWYVFDFHLRRDNSNICGHDSAFYHVKDSVYVIVYSPVSNVYLTGNALLCPGDTTQIYAHGTGNYTWTGPAFINMIGDSIGYAVSAGDYTVTSTVTDSHGCHSSTTDHFILQFKQSTLSSNPNPSLICPGDSVMLIADPGLSYDWYGPYGLIATTTNNTFWVHNPGFYHVVMIDPTNCELVSNMLELLQYGTPDLEALPQSYVCPGVPVTLLVTSSIGSTILWQSPLSGSDSAQVVVAPGTYTCSVLSCNINTTLSITVTNSNPVATITPSGPLQFCQGDSVILTGNPGMLSYSWLPVGSNDPSVTIHSSGIFTLQTTNVDGCDAISSPVIVTVRSVAPPIVNDTTICSGSSVGLFASGTGIVWYDLPSGGNIIHTGPSFSIGPVFNDTVFYISASDTCVSPRVPLHVFVNPSSLAPSISVNDSVCFGGTLNFYAPYFASATYNWTGTNGFTSNLQNFTINNASYSDSGNYTLVISVNGCTSQPSSAYVHVTPPLPAPVMTFDSPVCAGDTLHLHTPGTAGMTYSWSGPMGFLSTLQNPSVLNAQLTNSGNYYLHTLSGGCLSLADSILINVHPVPTPPLVSSNSPICAGDTLFLNASFIPGAIYHWIGPGGFLSSSQDTFVSVASIAESGVYGAVVLFNGCPSPLSFLNATVYPAPSPINISGDTSLCLNDSLSLAANFFSGATYSWSHVGGFLSGTQEILIDSAQLINSGYYVVQITLNSCHSSDSVNVSVYPYPPAPIAGSNSRVCAGDTLYLFSDSFSGASYSWYGENGFVSGIQNPFIDHVDTSYSGDYYVSMNVNGCAGDTTSVSVTVLPVPGNTNPSTNQPVCYGDTIQLISASLPGLAYQWNGPGGFFSTQNASSIPHATSAASGAYTLMTSLGPCPSEPFIVNVTVNPLPSPELGNDTTICQGSIILLDPGNYFSFIWSDGTNGSTLSVADSGMYFVLVTDNNGCAASDTINVSTTDCGFSEAQNIFSPNGDGVNDLFKISGDDIAELHVGIFNRWGKLVYEWNDVDAGWDGTLNFNHAQADAGVYFYAARIRFLSNEIRTVKGFVELIR